MLAHLTWYVRKRNLMVVLSLMGSMIDSAKSIVGVAIPPPTRRASLFIYLFLIQFLGAHVERVVARIAKFSGLNLITAPSWLRPLGFIPTLCSLVCRLDTQLFSMPSCNEQIELQS